MSLKASPPFPPPPRRLLFYGRTSPSPPHSQSEWLSLPLKAGGLRQIFPENNRPCLRFSRPFIQCAGDSSRVSDAGSISINEEGIQENGSHTNEPVTSNETLKKLKRYGISGILSYGLLNTAYYLTTFLLVWFYFAPAPGKLTYLAAVERFLKVMAMVWAGSQVTKLARAGGALALAPFVDRGLSWFTAKYGFKSREKAFFAIVASCFGLAVVLFLTVTLISACR